MVIFHSHVWFEPDTKMNLVPQHPLLQPDTNMIPSPKKRRPHLIPIRRAEPAHASVRMLRLWNLWEIYGTAGRRPEVTRLEVCDFWIATVPTKVLKVTNFEMSGVFVSSTGAWLNTSSWQFQPIHGSHGSLRQESTQLTWKKSLAELCDIWTKGGLRHETMGTCKLEEAWNCGYALHKRKPLVNC